VSKTDWSSFRSQFPVTARWAYLDHAAVTPLSAPAVTAIGEYATSLAENGLAVIKEWIALVSQVRQRAARLIDAPDPDDVYFIPNTTYGIGVIAEGFPWNPGDNVILAAEEYPSNQYPWMNLSHRGVEVRSIPSREGRVSIDDIRSAIDRRTRVLTISAVEFASGFRNDLDLLGELCREHELFFFVDAIQSLGVFPISVQKTPIDALAADGHKWLLGTEGAGIGFIRRDWVDRLHPIGVGANSVIHPYAFTTIDFRLKPHAGRWEGGTLNISGIAALGASMALLLDRGINEIERRVLELTDYLCDKAAHEGWRVFSSRAEHEKSGIVSLIHPSQHSTEVMKRCRSAGVMVNSRANRVRVSPHAYNTEGEIDQFLDAAR
jgi:cysteine desulfurase / selenocysteine lyase